MKILSIDLPIDYGYNGCSGYVPSNCDRSVGTKIIALDRQAMTAEFLPGIQRTATRHKMRMPNEFILITKQLLYFDRYAKSLAPKLNVFTDPRLVLGDEDSGLFHIKSHEAASPSPGSRLQAGSQAWLT